MPTGITKVYSNLKVEYEIFVPAKISINFIDIKNSYGNVSIKNVEGKIDLKNEYGAIKLSNIKGKIKLISYFSDINAENLNGSYISNTNHSDVNLDQLSGSYTIDAVFGSVTLAPIDKLSSLKAKVSNGDLTIDIGNCNQYNYSLSASYGNITFPVGCNYEFSIFTDAKKELFTNSNPKNPVLRITTSFGKILIK